MLKVCVFLADGFEEVEGLTVVDLLRRADVDVTMVSVMDKRKITGAHNITVEADKLFDEIDYKDVDGLVLPGGMPGTTHLAEHSDLIKLLSSFNDENKLIAAICAAPSILGQNKMLINKKATCFPGMEDKLEGAILSKDSVVVDGNIITSRGVGTAIDFTLAIIEKLINKETSDNIAEEIVYKV